MAFSATTLGFLPIGDQTMAYGSYTQGNTDTGGAITTGLSSIRSAMALGATVASTVSSGTFTIVTADPGGDQTGYWFAIGRG